MLELLLYCHMIANMKYAGHFAAVTAFIAMVKAQCDRLFASVASGRKHLTPVFEGWTEQELVRLLARLDAYVRVNGLAGARAEYQDLVRP